jgi:hypothetical protein
MAENSAEYMKRWKKNNADSYLSILLKHRYGITLDVYKEMLEFQNGVCAICGKPETIKRKTRLSVDHCHDTLKVRGLLCDQCNKGLGNFKHNKELLSKALKYLE